MERIIKTLKGERKMLQITEQARDEIATYIRNSIPKFNTVAEVAGIINHLASLKPIEKDKKKKE